MTNKTKWTFIIVAAGTGSRLGGELKQFRLLKGEPIWKWSLDIALQLLSENNELDIILVVPPSYFDEFKTSIITSNLPVKIVSGGKTRASSVYNALKFTHSTYVLIHDAARPFLTKEMCLTLMKKCDLNDAAIPVLKSTDSLKIIINGDISCIDRDLVYTTQTPQAFKKEKLMNILEKTNLQYTDEASVWLNKGLKISTIEGDENNFKITTENDWKRAVLMTENKEMVRVGHGYDIHQLVPNHKLILAGVQIEDSPLGLKAHSDGDVVFHAVMDSLLGAAGEPDIGTLFPATDSKWKNANSAEMLKKVIEILRLKQWRINWVDVTLIAQTPRLANRLNEFKSSLFFYLKELESDMNVNMKLKSPEECGSAGRSECIICHSIATISKF